jgi:nucleoside diphosphate kinase
LLVKCKTQSNINRVAKIQTGLWTWNKDVWTNGWSMREMNNIVAEVYCNVPANKKLTCYCQELTSCILINYQSKPNFSIPIRLLNKREKKKGVLKLLKKFTDKGFIIENGKLTKIDSTNINELYKHEKYDPDVGDYDGKPINHSLFLLDKLKEYKFKSGDLFRLIITADVKDKKFTVEKLILDDEKGYIKVDKLIPANEAFKDNLKDWNSNIDKNIIINITIKVPKYNNKGETSFNNDESSFNNQRYLWYNSDYPNLIAFLLANKVDTRFVVTKQIELTEANISQKYAEGVNHCLLNPILEWAKQTERDSKGVSKNKYQSIISKLEGKTIKSGAKIGYIEKYKNGIPEDEIQSLSDDLRVKISIEYPLRTNNNFIEFIPDRKALKTFSYVNTRLNHVEHFTTTNYKDMVDDEMNQDEINIKFNELIIMKNILFLVEQNTVLVGFKHTTKYIN